MGTAMPRRVRGGAGEGTRGPRHLKRGDDSRMALLIAASDLMIERRTIELSLIDIAERAQLNSALIRYYFGSKQAMMLALLKLVIGQGVDEMRALFASDRTPAEKLRLHIAGIVRLNARYPYLTRLTHLLFKDPKLAPDLADTISKPVALAHAALLREGVAQGVFRPLDPIQFFYIVFGASEHLFRTPEILDLVHGIDAVSDDLRRDYAGTLADLVLKGLAPERSLKDRRGPA